MVRLVVAALLALALFAQEKPAAGPSLTAEQKQTLQDMLQKAETETKTSVEPLAQKLAVTAKNIDLNLLSEHPDAALDAKLSGELADAVAQTVRSAMELRLKVVRAIVQVLTPEQKKLVQAELEKPGANPDMAETVTKMFGLKK
jgi:Spy/CpxP family protein refolding chaperone